jgi:hypothetical protein
MSVATLAERITGADASTPVPSSRRILILFVLNIAVSPFSYKFAGFEIPGTSSLENKKSSPPADELPFVRLKTDA